MNAQDAILAFLRSEEAKFDKGSDDPKIGVDGRERCRAKASALRTAIAYIERGDHLAAVERTPETVLRAMVAAYAQAAVDAEAEVFRHGAGAPIQMKVRMFDTQDAFANMRATAATYFAEGELLPWLNSTDYAARLAGTRPLDAPPLEN